MQAPDKKYPHGTFSWVDLATTDPAAAKAFYGKVLGWEAHDFPAGEQGVYTMFNRDDAMAAGMYALNAEQLEMGLPPHWMSYISVDDADAIAAKASELGGTVIVPPMDVMESGRMAMIQDPTGAMFAIWQPGQHIGAGSFNAPGFLAWNELMTHDTEAAETFYTELFGWGTHTEEMPTGPYTAFLNGERMNAGLMAMPPDAGEMPSVWGTYFGVKDCDVAIKQMQELGGSVLFGPMEIDAGKFATVQDPQGAVFTVIELAGADEPLEAA